MGEIGELYEPFAEEKRIALSVRTESELIVRGDRDLLFEAIANPVDNAIKFTPEGGGVDVCLTSRGNDGFVRVTDTGPGGPRGRARTGRATILPIRSKPPYQGLGAGSQSSCSDHQAARFSL
jgi:K+-sensing histidine kinase KdpD